MEGRAPSRPSNLKWDTTARVPPKLFLRRRWRRCRRSRGVLVDTESPMRFDFLAFRFCADEHCGSFVPQLLRDLVGERSRLRIVAGGYHPKSAHAHLHARRIDLSH